MSEEKYNSPRKYSPYNCKTTLFLRIFQINFRSRSCGLTVDCQKTIIGEIGEFFPSVFRESFIRVVRNSPVIKPNISVALSIM